MSRAWENQAQVLAKNYPDALSALLPILALAQKEEGCLTPENMEAVASVLGVTPAYVRSVASFYTLYRYQPRGKYLIQICTNISCSFLGAEGLLAYLENRLGVSEGQTTPDGLFTLETVECLAACGEAPAMQVNLEYYGSLTPEKIDGILAHCRRGEPLVGELIPPPGQVAQGLGSSLRSTGGAL